MNTREEGLVQEVRRTMTEWDKAREETNRVRSQFIATGPFQPGERIRFPPRIFDEQGMQELQAAEEKEKAAWDSYQRALDAWRRGKSSQR